MSRRGRETVGRLGRAKRVLRRAWKQVKPTATPNRDRRWATGSLVMLLLAGMLFTLTANTAAGTSLRIDQDVDLLELVPVRNGQVQDLENHAASLREEVDELTSSLDENGDIAAEEERAQEYAQAAGLTAVRGPGIIVTLNDAPRVDGELPPGATVDDVVVHQQDVQAVVNALWAGGAEAMMIMDSRIVSTSAVRCVGNTLLLHGQVYSPPFVIAAIGDNESMNDALDVAPGVRAFVAAAAEYGLGYTAESARRIEIPAFDGPTDLVNAEVPR